MSAPAALRHSVKPAEAGRRRRHRLWIQIGATFGVAVTVALAAYGLPYYLLSPAHRVLSPHHDDLRASGAIGRALGIAGSVLLLLIYLYPLRKRWRWLAKKGKTKNWLDYHILMGVTAPMLITFHSSFKFHGVAGMAYWSMIAVVLSGIVGRYLYSRIPRKLGEVEMSLEELERLRTDLKSQIEAQDLLAPGELEKLLALPTQDEVRQMPLLVALWKVGALDVRRWFAIRRLGRRAATRVQNHRDLRHIIDVIRRQASLSKDALFLSKIRRLFQLWHVVHRPFSWALIVLAGLHIFVVTFLGF